MRTLVAFDSCFLPETDMFSSFGRDDCVVLMPFTTKTGIINAIAAKLYEKGCIVEHFDTAHALNITAGMLKDIYVKFIAELPSKVKIYGRNLREHFALDGTASLWWMSLVAEKNTNKSGAFNAFVQAEVIINYVRDNEVKKVFLGGMQQPVSDVVCDFCKKGAVLFERISAGRDWTWPGRHIKHFTLLIGAFAVYSFRAIQIKKSMSRLPGKRACKGDLMFVSYYPNIDVEAAEKGVFRNRYYAKLQEALEDNGDEIAWVLIYVKNRFMSLKSSLDYAEKFIKNGKRIFFLQEFVPLAVYFKTLCRMIVNGLRFLLVQSEIEKHYSFKGHNFYAIFKDEWYASFLGKEGYANLLFYEMFKGLFKERPALLGVYYCEMQGWERAMLSANSREPGNTKLIGYQHATISPMLLNYFNNGLDFDRACNYAMPMPYCLVSNGRRQYEIFRSCGWPLDSLCVAEAIRYEHLNRTPNVTADKTDALLVAFPINPAEGRAILRIVCEAFSDSSGIQVWLKPHPFLDFKKVLDGVEDIARHAHFKITDKPIEELMRFASVVISGESGAALESLAFGCSVITINLPEHINMSPLGDITSPVIRNVSTPDSLRKEFFDLLTLQKTDNYDDERRALLDDFFCFGDNVSGYPVKFLQVIERIKCEARCES